ncbi:MAG: acetyl-CoA carboxylase biotin carboxyl carrier protein subunit, partial [Veillonella sp.]|nr:acetyl-CoA carboxylase biotin carboxyl carrier protein subunit [Veillonella sp.]
MKKFNVTVNGTAYDVEVNEVKAAAPAAAPKAAPAAAPKAAPAPA